MNTNKNEFHTVGKGGEDPGGTLVADVTPRAPNGEGGVNIG